MTTNSIITLNNVSFSYQFVPVLTNVTIEISNKSMVYIVGPNGGGKTTLLRLILGLLKPDQGKITVLGQKPEISCRLIGYVPQTTSFDNLFPASVLDVVLMGRVDHHLFGPFCKKDYEAAHKALSEVGLSDTAKHPFAQLSGGQRQRVLIARALALDPTILFLDEPTAHVDTTFQEDIHQLLQNLNKRLTVIQVTHDLGVVSQHATDVICVNKKVLMSPVNKMDAGLINEIWGHDVQVLHHNGSNCPCTGE